MSLGKFAIVAFLFAASLILFVVAQIVSTTNLNYPIANIVVDVDFLSSIGLQVTSIALACYASSVVSADNIARRVRADSAEGWNRLAAMTALSLNDFLHQINSLQRTWHSVRDECDIPDSTDTSVDGKIGDMRHTASTVLSNVLSFSADRQNPFQLPNFIGEAKCPNCEIAIPLSELGNAPGDELRDKCPNCGHAFRATRRLDGRIEIVAFRIAAESRGSKRNTDPEHKDLPCPTCQHSTPFDVLPGVTDLKLGCIECGTTFEYATKTGAIETLRERAFIELQKEDLREKNGKVAVKCSAPRCGAIKPIGRFKANSRGLLASACAKCGAVLTDTEGLLHTRAAVG